MTIEVWLPIRGYENYYEVSSFGNVRGLDRVVGARSNGSRVQKGTVLNPALDSRGYLQVNLQKATKSKMQLVHRLVALAFLSNPDNKRDVNHIDFIRTNNNVENLEWATPSENNLHTYLNGRGNHKKLAVELLNDSGEIIHSFDSMNDALRFLGKKISGYPQQAIRDGYKCYGFYWKYKKATES